ncbi:ATP-binding cassette domain-containing protein [Curtobacterium sp. Leaf261]|uniref:ATP-binding cassette domain-containing protein n=1 Tax=Curtobacterium sp. Leaf261 TaxID=1736311 RepID=UPI0006F5AB13|nr:ATP-binding cassette domain-containing protein [Curtobacterium sp. Leaf261]KQO63134.1 peptide ABC transporter ATP-binding protein [Curtobacterium sp. Leaf261]
MPDTSDAANTSTEPLLRVRDLEVAYPARGFRKTAQIIRGVSFDVGRGETLGLVGESGSGKTTIGRAILGLAPVTGGSIAFHGTRIDDLSRSRRRRLAQGIQVVFQDPYSSLNPSLTIEDILTEPLRVRHAPAGRDTVARLLDAVGLPSDAGSRLAREFSGGQRQRIAIARALALEPELIICDEPTSALDMTTQSRVLDLLTEIQQRTGVAYVFISHDLGVVRRMSDRTAVLLNGEIVELDDADTVALHPEHPYTQRLQMATPVPDPVAQEQRRADRHRLLEAQRTLLEHTGAAGDPWTVEPATTSAR